MSSNPLFTISVQRTLFGKMAARSGPMPGSLAHCVGLRSSLPLSGEEGTASKHSEIFTRKPASEFGLDCLICAEFARKRPSRIDWLASPSIRQPQEIPMSLGISYRRALGILATYKLMKFPISDLPVVGW